MNTSNGKRPGDLHESNPKIPSDQTMARITQLGMKSIIGLSVAGQNSTNCPMVIPIRDAPDRVSMHYIIVRADPITRSDDPALFFQKGVRERGASGRSSGAIVVLGKEARHVVSAIMTRDGRFTIAKRPTNKSDPICRWTAPMKRRPPQYQSMYDSMRAYHKGEAYYERGRQN